MLHLKQKHATENFTPKNDDKSSLLYFKTFRLLTRTHISKNKSYAFANLRLALCHDAIPNSSGVAKMIPIGK